MVIQVERLKRDEKEALYYQRKLMKKGQKVRAYQMQKKIEYIKQHIEEMSHIQKG
jgi:hypothetical protein